MARGKRRQETDGHMTTYYKVLSGETDGLVRGWGLRHFSNDDGDRAVFIEPRAPGENRSWGPSFPFFKN